MVTETFFAVLVTDMQRAIAFYSSALAAQVKFSSPGWTSLMIAGVRVGLAHPGTPGPTGLHFAVADLKQASAAIERAGGRCDAPVEVAPGVIIACATDTEGNGFTLRG